MRLRLLKLACIVACCGLLPLMAQQRGQYMPGQYGLNAGILPSPGFTYVDMNVNYNSTTLNDASGNATPVTGSYNVWAIENIFYYVPSFKVAGGNLGFMVAFPTLANGDLGISTFGVNGGGYGLADTWLQPFTIGWHLKRADITVADAIWLTTGRYTPGASNNIGYGYLGNHFTTGSTFYLTKNKGTSANLFTDWEVHGNKHGTNITPGQAFSDEWGVGQVLPLKKNFSQLLQLGGVGYDQWQVTANSGVDKNAPFYSVHAAGLQANYILPAKNFSLFFKYYWQYKAYSTSLGNTLTVGFAWTLPDPKPTPPKP
jgi:hypothetical protein